VTFARLINTTPLKIDEPFEYQRLTLRAMTIDTSIGTLGNSRGAVTGVLDGVHCEIVK